MYYDPEEITYEGLVEGFWRFMDPTDANGQFVDRGQQYRPAIFYHDDAQRKSPKPQGRRWRIPAATTARL